MTRKHFHGLKKVKVRASWNRANLYNLARLPRVNREFDTFYQQKWLAKSTTRAYHGEHVREGYWERMFRPQVNAVQHLDHRYLAEKDGSEQAFGRGSGIEKPFDPSNVVYNKNKIPYMHMTYAPLERRLDMAVWRALFASSARQARQFCINGKVRVNGVKMPYAGYLLNPGDMFQVEPDSVLFATGKKKESNKRREMIEENRQKTWRRIGKLKMKPKSIGQRDTATKPAEATELATLKWRKVDLQTDFVAPETIIEARSERNVDLLRYERRLGLDGFLLKTQEHYNYGRRFLGAKRKQGLRQILRDLKTLRANINNKSEAELDAELSELVDRAIVVRRTGRFEKPDEALQGKPLDEGTKQQLYQRYLKIRVEDPDPNPIDETKPYATPWSPRPYMSPFAFIPRYLEVNQRICSAVYLRHPVARPGLCEVPSPFAPETQQLAFTWYLRRR